MSENRLAKPTKDVPQTHDGPASPQQENASATPSTGAHSVISNDQGGSGPSTPPQLPQNPDVSALITPVGSLRVSKASARPKLQGHATTAVSRTDIHGATRAEQSLEPKTPTSQVTSRRSSFSKQKAQAGKIQGKSDDSASVRSILSKTGTLDTTLGAESLLRDGLVEDFVPHWNDAETDIDDAEDEEAIEEEHHEQQKFESRFLSEFVEVDELKAQGNSEESLMLAWSLKLKHFFILSSAGKPIWSRHGDDELISNSIGVIQTIIAFYQGSQDTLKSFTAGNARFCIVSKGHLFLVAVSRMGENDTQLRSQLEALYMQILSTLTLTKMEKMFLNRPSTDLRRPLQGTEKLLSALADGFTRGSPSTLLSALECLRMKKTHRMSLNNCFLKARAASLLYGLLVTDTGQLVSVLRPKKHSLHPGDLQIIFNMLFEAKGIRAGGGESWVPLCLPGFNNTGFVYMYVSFLDIGLPGSPPQSPQQGVRELSPSPIRGRPPPPQLTPQGFCLVLISAQPDSFDGLKTMRDAVVTSVTGTTSPNPDRQRQQPSSLLQPLRNAIANPRLSISTIAPGTPLIHFLYKSRLHVQFVMPETSAQVATALSWRYLMKRYSMLHSAVHSRGGGRNKMLHLRGRSAMSGAWATQDFEIYAIAEGSASRQSVAKGMEMVVKWCKKEEERLFVVGGAVF